MQERRTTIRINHRCLARYAHPDDLLPQDGLVRDLSERGAGVLMRDRSRYGAQVNVTFPLPGDRDSLTLAGVVRWATPRSREQAWAHAGVEWLPLDAELRQRLTRFLCRAILAPSPPSARGVRRWLRAGPFAASRVGWAVVAGLLAAGACGLWAFTVRRERAQLHAFLMERDAAVRALEQQERELRSELNAAQAHVSLTSEEVAQAARQAQGLEGKAQQLAAAVSQLQEVFLQLQQERRALIERVLTLEQERLALIRRSVPSDAVQAAVREAVARRARSGRKSVRTRPP